MNINWQWVCTSVAVQLSLIAWYHTYKARRLLMETQRRLKRLETDENRFNANVTHAIERYHPRKVNLFTSKQIPPPLPLGEEGDFAFCTVYPFGRYLYGPKRADGWGKGFSLESISFFSPEC